MDQRGSWRSKDEGDVALVRLGSGMGGAGVGDLLDDKGVVELSVRTLDKKEWIMTVRALGHACLPPYCAGWLLILEERPRRASGGRQLREDHSSNEDPGCHPHLFECADRKAIYDS